MHVINYCFNAVSHRPSKLTTVRRINVVCGSENGGIHALNEEENYSPVTEAHLFLKFHKVFQSSRLSRHRESTLFHPPRACSF